MAYGDEGWNDEVMIGAEEEKVAEWEDIAGRLVSDGTTEEEEKIVLESREGVKGDKRSLARCLDETVYLVVKGKGKGTNREGEIIEVDVWEFPRGDLKGNEMLHSVCFFILSFFYLIRSPSHYITLH